MSAPLPDGLRLRTATPADVPGITRLLADRGEPADGVDLELVAATEGLDGVAVVVDGDRVVSTLTLLDEVVEVGDVAVPAGQVELVATTPEHEGKGLVRALMAWAHDRSRERGHLLQVMIGIPFFYRQFGYEYVTPMAPWRPLVGRPERDPAVEVRRATHDDITDLDALQRHAQAGVDVRMGHRPACWRWLLERTGSELWVATRDGRIVAVSRTLPPNEGPGLAELAATDDAAALTLVAHAADHGDRELTVQQRRGTTELLEPHLGPPREAPDWYYARVERLGPLLRHLAPVLVARVAAAGLADEDHEVLLSCWRSHVRFRIGRSGFALLAEGGAEQAPISKGGSGVPPDAVAQLLLGPHGALGLEERLPDCYLGRQRDLMAALFPPVTADLLTFYLPT